MTTAGGLARGIINSFSATTVALVLLILLGGMASGSPSPMEVRRLDRLLDEITGANPPELAYPILLSLDTFEGALSTERLEESLTALTRSSAHPMVRALAAWRLAALHSNLGQVESAREELRSLGMLERWHIIGPFPNEGMAGYDTAYLPEERIDVGETVDGTFPELRWRSFESRGRGGYVRLSSVVAPTNNSVSYLATVLESDRQQDAVLWLTIDGAFKVWVAGQLAGEQREDQGGAIDREGFKVSLTAGPNLVLIKVANETGYAGVYARLTHTDLSPFPMPHGNTAPSLEVALPVVGEDHHVQAPLDSLEVLVDAMDPTAPGYASAKAWLAYGFHRVRPGEANRPWEGLVLEALAVAPSDVDIVTIANEVLEEDWRRRETVEAALLVAPDDPWLLSLRLEQLLNDSSYSRATEITTILETLRGAEPDSVVVALKSIRREGLDGLKESALNEIIALAEKNPKVLDVTDDLYWRAKKAGRTDLATKAVEQLVEIRGDIETNREDLCDLLLQRGDDEEALAVLDEGLLHRPDGFALAIRRAEVLGSLGRLDEARQAFEQIIAETPTAASLYEQYGDWLLRHDDTPAALEMFRTSLRFEAQNESLRRLVRYLDPSAESFESPYVISEVDALPSSTSTTDDYAILLEQTITLVHPNGLSSVFTQTVYEVLSDEGASALKHIPIYYTPNEEVLEIALVRVLKPDGSVRQAYERDEYSVADESIRMYYDYRQVQLTIPDLDVGDRLELQHRKSQVSQSNYFDNYFGDLWFVQDTVPKNYTRYVLLTPKGWEMFFHVQEQGPSTEIEKALVGDHMVYTIERFEVPKIESEPMMPGFSEVADHVIVSTFSSWSQVGKWYWNLVKDQWLVDKEMKEVVKKLVAGVDSRRERVSIIHNYVLKNTRYVALEFGVHGYKPYRTTVCFRRKFGDCKDKASLTKVMLEEAGIPADIVLARTRRNGKISQDPPTLSIFDHAISYVPEFDLFLDGTAEFSGTSELPAMDQGIDVLIVKAQGEIESRTTPIFPPESNSIDNRYKLTLSATGEAKMHGKGVITGEFAPSYRQRYESVEKRHDAFEDELSREYHGAAITALEFFELDDLEKPVSFEFDADIASLTESSGEQLVFYPHGHKADLADRLAPSAKRKQDLMLPFMFHFDNRFEYTLPTGYSIDSTLEDVHLESEFGDMSIQFETSGQTLTVQSALTLAQSQIPADSYAAFQAFVLQVDRILNTPIALSRVK